MKKNKVVVGILSMAVVLALVTGCSSSEKQAASQSPAGQQTSGHEGMKMSGNEDMKMSMPKEDPMPMMKDMDQQLQDLMKQVKAGQTMEAQKTAGQLASITEKIMPHMMDNGLKDSLRKAAGDIKNTVNSGKIDPSAMESKVKTMQDVMKQTTSHLQSMQH